MAEMAVRYEVNKKQQSEPVSLKFLANEWKGGRITNKTRVWCKGMEKWTAIGKCSSQKWYPQFVRLTMTAKLTLRYEVRKGKQSDPVTVSEMVALLSDPSSGVTEQTLVWAVGMPVWTELAGCADQPWFEEIQAAVPRLQAASPESSSAGAVANATDAVDTNHVLDTKSPVHRLEPEPEPQSTQPTLTPAAVDGEPPPGSQIHVRGIGGKFETEEALAAVFEPFGSVLQATVRHRIDEVSGANTSWALVTMESKNCADKVIAGAESLPTPVTVARFSPKIAASSTGQMGQVRQEAAAKVIQKQWRGVLGYREAFEMSLSGVGLADDWHDNGSPLGPAGTPQLEPEPEPEPQSTQPTSTPAAVDGEPPPGSQIHVRGIGGKFETEEALAAVFEPFGSVLQATVRHRIDEVSGANTSWALVTMESKNCADKVIAGAESLPTPVTVTRFSPKIAASSTGQMGQVRQEAAAKVIQKLWRGVLGYREAFEMSLSGVDLTDDSPPLDPAGTPQSQVEVERKAHAVTQEPGELEKMKVIQAQTEVHGMTGRALQAEEQVKILTADLETARAEITSIQAALEAEKAAHARTKQELKVDQSEVEKAATMEKPEQARTEAIAAEAAKTKPGAEIGQLHTELQTQLKKSLAEQATLKQQLEQDARASRAAIEHAEARAANAVQQLEAEVAHTADVARDLRECRRELSRTRSTASEGGEEATKLEAALAGEAAAKEQAAILQKTLDASIELCKRAEKVWEARHEEHCKEMETLRAKVTAFVQGEDWQEPLVATDTGGDDGMEAWSGKRDSPPDELPSGPLAVAEEVEEGIPGSVPLSKALPHGHAERAIGAAAGDPGPGAMPSATLSAPGTRLGLSPVSTASSLPYNGIAARSGPGFDGTPEPATMFGGEPPASPLPTGTSSAAGNSRSSSTAGGTIHAL